MHRILPNTIRVFDPEDVTTRSDREVPAEDLGLSPDAVEEIWRAVVGLYRTGLHPAIALCLRYRGQIVLDRAIGHARGNAPGDPPDGPRQRATPDTLYNLFSASKSITAMLVHQLDDKGLLHLDDPVEEYLPGFGRRGKAGVTLRHVLTHTAGIPAVPGPKVDLDLLTDPEAIVELLCDAAPESAPGRRLAYHAITGGFVLGEVVRRVTGKNIRQVLKEEVRDPLGFKHLSYGVDPVDLPRVAHEAFTGPVPRFPFDRLFKKAIGVDLPEAIRLAQDPRFLTAIVPAGNVIGTPDEVCRFFELLRNNGELDGVRVFDRRTVRRATAEQTYLELDTTLMLPIRYGSGFILGSDWLSFYGPGTPKAFGHLGLINILAWADPERELSAALMNTGKPLITPHILPWLNIPLTIARRVPRNPVD